MREALKVRKMTLAPTRKIIFTAVHVIIAAPKVYWTYCCLNDRWAQVRRLAPEGEL